MKATAVVLTAVAAVAAVVLAGVAVVTVKATASGGAAALRDDHSAARALERRLELLEASIDSLSREISALEAAAVARAVPTASTSLTVPARVPAAGTATETTSEAERRLAEARARAKAATRQMRSRIDAVGEFVRLDVDLESRLISEGGFPRERAREINARVSELRAEGRARIEEHRESTGGDPCPLVIEMLDDMERTLRDELGDADYERYRVAAGLSTNVTVSAVEPNSIAERAGILPGDVIVAHDGTRVMDLPELEQLIAQGPRGTNALIEVIRNGEPMQLYVPSGPWV